MGQNIVGIEKKSAGQIYRKPLYRILSVRAHLFWIVTKAIEINSQYTLLLLSYTTELLLEHYCCATAILSKCGNQWECSRSSNPA